MTETNEARPLKERLDELLEKGNLMMIQVCGRLRVSVATYRNWHRGVCKPAGRHKTDLEAMFIKWGVK